MGGGWIYYYLTADHQVWLFTFYGKEEAEELTASMLDGPIASHYRRFPIPAGAFRPD